jgi:hypothetical protein
MRSINLRQSANSYTVIDRAPLYTCINSIFDRGTLNSPKRHFYNAYTYTPFTVVEYVEYIRVKDNVWRY